jgi:hypothetical protein
MRRTILLFVVLLGFLSAPSLAVADCSAYCDRCGQKGARYQTCDACNSCREREARAAQPRQGSTGTGEVKNPPAKSQSDRTSKGNLAN